MVNDNMIKKLFSSLIILVSATVFINAQSGTTQYVYDDNGRLIAVVSPGGETAVYEYDPAGNIISITRQNQPPLYFESVSSPEAAVGTQITIRGLGFIADVSQNTVTFNNTVATVVSASTAELRVLVPETATVGKIRISNTNGSVESSFEFIPLRTITPNSPAQTLVVDSVNRKYVFDFSGTGGKNLSLLLNQITSNFDITVTSPSGTVVASASFPPQNNKIFIDKKPLTETGDYRIEVNSIGNENSASVELSVYEFDDVTGSISTDGTPTNFLILYPGQDANFDLNISQANQPAFLNINNTTATPYDIFVTSPTGAFVASSSNNSSGVLVQLQNTSEVGIYRVRFNTDGDNIGSGSIAYQDNVSNQIVVDGPELQLLIPSNESGEVFLVGNAGQRAIIYYDSGPFQLTDISIFKPNGELLVNDTKNFQEWGYDIVNLPETGVYRILLDPQDTAGGVVKVSAKSTGQVGGNCPFSNRFCNLLEIFATPDQTAEFEFDVTDGGGGTPIVFEFNMSEINIPGTIGIYDLNNNLLGSFNISAGTETFSFNNAGFYKLKITPGVGETGSFKLKLKNNSYDPPQPTFVDPKSNKKKRIVKVKGKN